MIMDGPCKTCFFDRSLRDGRSKASKKGCTSTKEWSAKKWLLLQISLLEKRNSRIVEISEVSA